VNYKVGETASSLTVHMKCRENIQTGSKFIQKNADDVTTSETKLSSLNKEIYVKIYIMLLKCGFLPYE
jgi:hypothetical protein